MTYQDFSQARALLATQQGIPPEAVPIPAVLAALSPPAATQTQRVTENRADWTGMIAQGRWT
jgi:hypothetical protein